MDPSKVSLPPMTDLTVDNITENTIRVNSTCPDTRLTYIFERLVSHLHDFARETRISTKEWMAAINFLTAVGQKCTPDRQEFILLSDILGLSLLVDAINHPKPPHATEGSVLGPFHSEAAEHMPNGEALSHDPKGEPCLVVCNLKDSDGKPIEGAKIDIWETDSNGFYDVQYGDREGPDGRCVMSSDKDGQFWFNAIVPISYPIPVDGPVGLLLKSLHRHMWRPAHMHFMFEKPGYDHLITALYLRGDPYEKSDAVFGVKNSLVVDLELVDDATAQQYRVEPGTRLLKYDFVLVTDKEARDLRDELAKKALADLGLKMKLIDGLPIPDVD
ncbi:hypothetical protein MMC07_004308 [Pseudocyphellaria aurata]|nr:hypothetical protein [Pseudocyphellaria aurata]